MDGPPHHFGEQCHKEELTQDYKELFLPADGGERITTNTAHTDRVC